MTTPKDIDNIKEGSLVMVELSDLTANNYRSRDRQGNLRPPKEPYRTYRTMAVVEKVVANKSVVLTFVDNEGRVANGTYNPSTVVSVLL